MEGLNPRLKRGRTIEVLDGDILLATEDATGTDVYRAILPHRREALEIERASWRRLKRAAEVANTAAENARRSYEDFKARIWDEPESVDFPVSKARDPILLRPTIQADPRPPPPPPPKRKSADKPFVDYAD